MTRNRTASKVPAPGTLRVWWMTQQDLRQTLQIERSHLHSKEDQWLAADLLDFLPSPAHSRKAVVLQHSKLGTVGHAQFILRQDDLLISNVCVHKEYCRRGYGSLLVAALQRLPVQKNLYRARVCVPVRESDLAAQLFFKRLGFRWDNTQHGWFDTPVEDAYVLASINID